MTKFPRASRLLIGINTDKIDTMDRISAVKYSETVTSRVAQGCGLIRVTSGARHSWSCIYCTLTRWTKIFRAVLVVKTYVSDQK